MFWSVEITGRKNWFYKLYCDGGD